MEKPPPRFVDGGRTGAVAGPGVTGLTLTGLTGLDSRGFGSSNAAASDGKAAGNVRLNGGTGARATSRGGAAAALGAEPESCRFEVNAGPARMQSMTRRYGP